MSDFKPVTFYYKGKKATANNKQQYDHYIKMGWSTTPASDKAEPLPAKKEGGMSAAKAYKPLMLKKSDVEKDNGKPKYKNLMTKKFSKGGYIKYNEGSKLKKKSVK